MYVWEQDTNKITNIDGESGSRDALDSIYREYSLSCGCEISHYQNQDEEEKILKEAEDKIIILIAKEVDNQSEDYLVDIHWGQKPDVRYHSGMAHVGFKLAIHIH